MKQLFASGDSGIIGLMIFFAVFCLIVFWVLRPGSKETYQECSEIPLKEDDTNE